MLERFLDFRNLEALLVELREWLLENVFVLSFVIANLGQLVVALIAFLPAWFLEPQVRKWVEARSRDRWSDPRLRRLARALVPFTFPLTWLLLLWLAVLVASELALPHHVLKIITSLLTAWIIIRAMTSLVRNPALARGLALVVWLAAALNMLNLLGPTLHWLDSLALEIGSLRISLLFVLNAAFALVLFLGAAVVISRLVERGLERAEALTPAYRVLVSKLLNVTLVVLALIVALGSIGIDLTAFAVFGGAVGVGVGLGLQKAVANLFSGVALLADKSIKPGDVISVGDSYGWVREMNSRYVSVVTRDGIEHLIPNEELISSRVENWSHSNNLVRLKLTVGVSYRSDVEKAIALCLEAVRRPRRVLREPAPACFIQAFGDSSVDLSLRFWINDPRNGVSNVKGEVLLEVWRAFAAHGIEIPFPQRDLHLRSIGGEALAALTSQTSAGLVPKAAE